ncbi:MAG: hypothetical protein KY476_21625 [Planctomycetes bacterium]|nr:hypothetical protein [Planctomycetota bacterium]
MRTFLALLTAAALAFAGCGKETEEGGPDAGANGNGAPANGAPANGAVDNGMADNGLGDDTTRNGRDESKDVFTLTLPEGATDITAGKTVEVTINVNRKGEFKDAVTVSLQPPQGVQVEPKEITVQPGVDEATFQVSALPGTPAGERTVQVQGEGAAGGRPSEGSFKIMIEKAEEGYDTPGTNDNPLPRNNEAGTDN